MKAQAAAINRLRVQMPPLHKAQAEVAHHSARFRVLCTGRRFGKTRLGTVLTIATSLDNRRVWWVAPSYPMASIGWREIKRLAIQIPGAAVRESERMVTMPTGGLIQVKSADNPPSLRGEGLDLVVMDECAYIAEDAWQESLRPALSDRQGRALFISTPQRRNWFYALYQRGVNRETGWRSWQLPTAANPYIPREEIEAARNEMPADVFRQEYEAAFLENGGTVFRNIDACLIPNEPRESVHAHAYHRVVAGVDFAQLNDWTAVCVFCVDCSREVELDRYNQINWEFQLGRIIATAQKWQVADLVCEQNSIGSPLIEQLSQHIEVRGFETTAASKPPLIQSLALAFERNEAKWRDINYATEELKAFEVEVSPHTGRPTFNAAPGHHDDTVIARAIAYWACQHPAGAFSVSTFER